MSSEIDSFGALEKSVMENMRMTYSEKVIDHFLNPRNAGEFDYAEGYAKVTGPCGDTMQICLKVKDDIITEARFMTDGCGASIACGSATTELTIRKSITEALEITQDDILNSLEGLSESEVHCALLAANTLKQAVKDYLSLRREPWKKAYRTIEPFGQVRRTDG